VGGSWDGVAVTRMGEVVFQGGVEERVNGVVPSSVAERRVGGERGVHGGGGGG